MTSSEEDLEDVDDILAELDAYAESDGKSRSGAVTSASGHGSSAPPAVKNSALQAALHEVRNGAKRLDLSHWSIRLGVQGGRTLAEALRRPKMQISTILLNNSSIGAHGIAALAEPLKTNFTITQLDISSNTLGDAGAAEIGQALKSNTTITKLDMESNGIGPAGAASLADGLRLNGGLKSLHLSLNSIGDQGASSLGNSLLANRTLTVLWVDGNQITSRGAELLNEAIVKGNQVIQTIHLGTPSKSSAVHSFVTP